MNTTDERLKDFLYNLIPKDECNALLTLEFEKYRIYGTQKDFEFNHSHRDVATTPEENSLIFKISPFIQPKQFIKKGYMKNLFTKAVKTQCVYCTEKYIESFKKYRKDNKLEAKNQLIENEEEFNLIPTSIYNPKKEIVKRRTKKETNKMREEIITLIPEIKTGNVVKVEFRENKRTEYMWVGIIEKLENDYFKGILLNNPINITSIKKDDKIKFHSKRIYDISNQN